MKAIRLIERLFRGWYLERDERLVESNRPMLVRVEFNQREYADARTATLMRG